LTESGPPVPGQARKSTLVVAAVFALICAVQVYRGRVLAAEITGGLATVLFMCAFIPPAAQWFFARWMALAAVLGYVNTRIILSAFFYLVMTPVSLVLRMTGYDAMARRERTRKATYWHRREATRQTRQGFERAY
jgi:hypothetical protein